MEDLFSLKGKVALVTGASQGLGKAMAMGLAKAGAHVVAVSRKIDSVKKTAEELRQFGITAVPMKCDVCNKGQIEKVVRETVKKFGRIDILVNNAGILKMCPAEDMLEKDWDAVIQTNLKGQFLFGQAVGKQMIQQKSGSIINIASIAGQFGFPLASSYDCSKGGVILLTKALAAEWGKHGIRVNAIAPGVFATAMTDSFMKDPSFLENVRKNVPLARAGKPEELAGAAVYLASEASSYMTGHVLVVDGGWTAGL
ncbi:glucose 1-dehydrogenase [Candidatus Woesearchaeota archaeon]|nr:glucose 1-dehydrogenase [Candidatus Woesearchaeota archaeon]